MVGAERRPNMKIIVIVPKNTMPYRCGERWMACEAHNENGKVKIDRCIEFFKGETEAKQYAVENGCKDFTTMLKVVAV